MINTGINEIRKAQFSIQGDVVNPESELSFLQREINMTNKRNKKQKKICISKKNILRIMRELKGDRKVQRNARHLPGRDGNGSGRR